jgi:hypothetical protein
MTFHVITKTLILVYLVSTIACLQDSRESLTVNPENEEIFRSEIRRNNTLPIFANNTANNNTGPVNATTNATSPEANNTTPSNEMAHTQPANNLPPANGNATQPANNASQPANNATQPSNATQPANNATQPMNNTAPAAPTTPSILPQFNNTEDLTASTMSSLYKKIYKANVRGYLELSKNVNFFGNNTCSILKGFSGIDDIVKYKTFMIGSSNDNLNMFLIADNVNTIPNGSLIQIDVKNKRMKKIPITGLPNNIAFHPLSLYVYQDRLLYVINNAYNKGGQRIEVFTLSDKLGNISLKYLKSILLDNSLMGIIGDLAVLADGQFYLTMEYPTADNPVTGRNRTEEFYDDYIGNIAQDLKNTFVYYCDSSESNKADCKQIKSTAALMNKGITFDGKNRLFVTNLIERMIKIYEINLNDPMDLKLIKTINSDYVLNNMNYDEKEKKIYGGLNGKFNEILDFMKAVNETKKLPDEINYSGGAFSYDITTDKIDYLLNQNVFYGINSAILRDGYIVMPSWFDNGILMCKR